MAECPCPACGFLTTGEQWFGSHNICEICGWVDDHVQLANPASRGGANHKSLIEVQQSVLRQISPSAANLKGFARDGKWRPLRPSEVECASLDNEREIWLHKGVEKYENSYWISNPIPKDIQVKLQLLKTDEGGRQGPIYSGYRPQFRYNDNDWVVSVIFTDVDMISPGSFGDAFIGFMSPIEHLEAISIEMKFVLCEGHRVVSHGAIKRIIDLEFSANLHKIRIDGRSDLPS